MDFPAQANKWLIVRTGQRGSDPWVAVHFGHYRFCFDGAVAHLKTAEKLENLTFEPEGRPRNAWHDERSNERLVERGVILFSIEWKGVYIVQRRVHWGPEEYFLHAARLFGERQITNP